jgi:hypothetical protein
MVVTALTSAVLGVDAVAEATDELVTAAELLESVVLEVGGEITWLDGLTTGAWDATEELALVSTLTSPVLEVEGTAMFCEVEEPLGEATVFEDTATKLEAKAEGNPAWLDELIACAAEVVGETTVRELDEVL